MIMSELTRGNDMKRCLVLFFIVACGEGSKELVDQFEEVVSPELVEHEIAEAAQDIEGEDAEPEVGDAVEVSMLPSHEFVHAVTIQPFSETDSPYKEDYAVLYRTDDKLPDCDVRAIAVLAQNVWVGTPSGIYRFIEGEDRFVKVPMPGGDSAVIDLYADVSKGTLLAAVVSESGSRVVTIGPNESNSYALDKEVTSVAGDNGLIWAGTSEGVMVLEAGTFYPIGPAAWGFSVRDLAVIGDTVFIATQKGLGRLNKDKMIWLTAEDKKLPDNDVRAVATDPVEAKVVAGCATGISLLESLSKVEIRKAGKGALPNDNVVSVAIDGNDLLIGHSIGATATAKDGYKLYDHYASMRFLPDNHVRAVAIGIDGSRWIATAGGVSRIRFRDVTLKQKEAKFFEHLINHYFRMDGFISSGAYTDNAWNPTIWQLSDEDNDGLWTQMGIAALCFAYSVTGDEKYYEAARRAIENMFLLIDVPASDFIKQGLTRGFVARSLVRDDEGVLFESKATKPNWHLVHFEDGHDYYWKDDTSSDETTGHFFGYPLYYDLCAKNKSEKQEVAEHAAALASYIIEGGYKLLDLDGQPTTFGHWAPDELAIGLDGPEACVEGGHTIEECASAMFGGGWLNSIEILGHLLAAWHMTGDPKFYWAYDELITKYRYDEVATFTENVYTATKPKIANHSDHELAMLALHTLIRYEPNEARRKIWINSLLGLYAWESGEVLGAGNERHPLWAPLVALAVSGKAHVEEAVRSLREYPSDLRIWRMDNTHRKDAGDWPEDRHGQPQFDTVFPYDELYPLWWNANPYAKIEDGDGRAWQGPTAWLLAYWAQRYSGILKDN